MAELVRYDLDRVYYLTEYNKAVAHAEQNMGIAGVKEQLDNLIAEKNRYENEVSALAEAERNNEQQKYEKYKKWKKAAQVCKWIFFGGLIGFFGLSWGIIYLGVLGELIALLILFAFWAGAPSAIISFLGHRWYARQYQLYVSRVTSRFESMGSSFSQTAEAYVRAIDDLYLNSLDPMQRELVLLRREQAKQTERLLKAEKDRQIFQHQLIWEQQRTRAVQEELLAIEREREREKERLRRGW